MLQLQVINFRKGSYIVVEGKEDSANFYIIQQGTVRSQKVYGGMPPVNYGPGDFVGVVPCMSGHAQIETAVAVTDVVAISVRKEQYPELISQNTPVALKIIKTFSNRMRVMNEMLSKATLKSTTRDDYEQLFYVGQFYEKARMNNVAAFAYYQYLKTHPTSENLEIAKQRFVALKQTAHPVFLESTPDLTRAYPKNTMIFSEAQSGADMFIIQQGEVTISKIVDGNVVTFAILGKGDMFGEMALLENKPRSASAIAHSDCVLMVVNRSNFNQMVSTQPQMIAKLTTTLADRLWSMYRNLDNANIVDPLFKMLDMLLLQLEKQRKHIDFHSALKQPYQTEYTPLDLANMCGIPSENQPLAIGKFMQEQNFQIQKEKIFIKDMLELAKQVAFLKKQQAISNSINNSEKATGVL